MTKPVLEILYDGDCPFCSHYVKMLWLQKNFDCRLQNAREHLDLVEKFRAQGMEVSDGFIVTLHGRALHGADALSLLSRLSESDRVLNRTLTVAFRNRHFARLSYPIMKAGRLVVLKLLGRKARIE